MDWRNQENNQNHEIRQMSEKEFQEIVSRAFSPDLPEPKFSARYYQHRKELEREVAMKELKQSGKSRESREARESREFRRAERSGKAGFALMTACVTGIAGLAVYSGIGIYNVGRTMQSVEQQSAQSGFGVGTAVQVPEDADVQSAGVMNDESNLENYSVQNDISFPFADYFDVDFQCENTDYTANGGRYDVVLGWVPDGLEYREDGAYGMKYHNYQDETDEHAITPVAVYNVCNTSMRFCENVDDTVSILEATFDENPEIGSVKRMICVRRSIGYDKLYVHFKGTPCVAEYFINGFTDEEVKLFTESLTLMATDQPSALCVDYTQEPTPGKDIQFFVEENDYIRNGGIYNLQLGWVPEDDTKIVEETSFVRLKDTSDTVFWQIESVPADVCEMSFDEQDGITKHMLWYRDPDTEQPEESQLMVWFEGSPYHVQYNLYNFDENDVANFVDGMTLIESDTEQAELYAVEDFANSKHNPEDVSISTVTSSDVTMTMTNFDDQGTEIKSGSVLSPDDMNLVAVGDVMQIPDSDITLQVNRAVLRNDFDGITTDGIGLPADYDQYFDADGNLYATRIKENEDGILETETVRQYILELDLTLAKTGTSSAIVENGMLFNMEYFSLDDENRIVTATHDVNGVRVRHEPELSSEDGFFSFYTESDHDKNGIYDLQAGKSVDLTVYYAIDEDMLADLYITPLDGAVGLYDPIKYAESGYPVLDVSDYLERRGDLEQLK